MSGSQVPRNPFAGAATVQFFAPQLCGFRVPAKQVVAEGPVSCPPAAHLTKETEESSERVAQCRTQSNGQRNVSLRREHYTMQEYRAVKAQCVPAKCNQTTQSNRTREPQAHWRSNHRHNAGCLLSRILHRPYSGRIHQNRERKDNRLKHKRTKSRTQRC
jgi:hypothetical protein